MIHFPRETLALELVAALRGQAVFGDAHNGLFLAAPRRTGKSTFLQADLKPALEKVGVVVTYVDLWADPRRDPGSLISEAIARTLSSHLGLVSRAARVSGLESVTIAGALKIDLSRIGKVDGITLPEALRALHDAAKSPVALIVDEAQQLTPHEAKTLVTRMGKGSKIILIGDLGQIDNPYVDAHTNGLVYARNRLQGQAFTAHVNLFKGERSEMAEVAANLM